MMMTGSFRYIFLLASFIGAGQAIAEASFIKQHESDSSYETYAVLTAKKETQISSEIDAHIKKIYFLPGDHFKQGELLIEFDCEPLDIQMQRLASITKATEAKHKSNLELKKMNSVSELELQNSETENEKAAADAALIKLKQDKCKVPAPYEGDVVAKLANEGEIIKVDDPLLDILSNTDLEVQMYIPSKWLSGVQVGTTFTISLNELSGATLLMGNITKIVGKVDAASQSILVFGQLVLPAAGGPKLFAGMSGTANFDINQPTN
jgi:membrane fusion protein, multidrug efflux system